MGISMLHLYNVLYLSAGDVDYLSLSMQSLPVPAGSSSACISVTLIDDNETESAAEFFDLVLGSSDSDVSISSSLAIVELQNEDREYIYFNP